MTAAAFALLTLFAMSAFADGALRGHARLPMQWGPSGRAGWTLPRQWALALTPLLAAAVLALALALEEEPKATEAAWVIGLSFVGAHALHLFLIDRALTRQ